MSMLQKQAFNQGYDDAFYGKDKEETIDEPLKPYYRSGQEAFVIDFLDEEYNNGKT